MEAIYIAEEHATTTNNVANKNWIKKGAIFC